MATKTISVDLEAYQRLKKVRLRPDESFSQVIKRAHWPEFPKTCRAFLERMTRLPVVSEESLQQLDRAQKEDKAPPRRWPKP